ncbi:TonB-dependent receptor plug domain-containing protein [Sphingobacterium lactis]|uniref:TonB-dependent receptor plug domain-containing protein n=1 Tax=Sphingobacterium lactis TaxID=797291 RepID=UPI003EC8CE27
MMKHFIALIILLCSSLSPIFLSAQTHVFQQQMDSYAANNPQEKIHMQTDREIYGAGETIFYKLYSTLGLRNSLSQLSNIAYVELIDPSGAIVSKKINTVFSGVGMGDIELVDTLVEGSYRMRAYTNWMRNAPTSYFFEKIINIGNLRSDNVASSSSLITEEGKEYYRLHLVNPQGGDWPKTTVHYDVLDGDKVIDRGREGIAPDGTLKIRVTDKNRGKTIVLRFTNINKSIVKKQIVTAGFHAQNSLQYFPEGGVLLADEVNRIAFKALNPNGLGVPATVKVLTSKKEVATTVTLNSLGMGSVNTPIAKGETYTVQVQFSDGTTQEQPLSGIVEEGYSLALNTVDSKKLYVQANMSESKVNREDLYVCLQHLGNILYMAKQKAGQRNVLFTIPKANLPTGVLTVTLLNQQFIPLAERAIFQYDQSSILPFTLQQNKPSYGQRELVSNTIQVGHETDTTRVAALSAAVVNMNNYQDEAEVNGNILSSLFLHGDIQGYIEKPGSYFLPDGRIREKEMDELMLTQAWRKINVHKLDSLIGVQPAFAPEKGLSIAGSVRRVGRKAPVPKAPLQLISTNDFFDFIDTVTNEQGEFLFQDLIYPDSVKFLLSARNQKGKNNVDIHYAPRLGPPVDMNLSANGIRKDINSTYQQFLEANKSFHRELEQKGLMDQAILIEEIVIRRERPKASENSSNLNGPGRANQTITADELGNCVTLAACLTGRLTGVDFRNGKPFSMRSNSEMQVILDGMYVEADMLDQITPFDVQSIEVLRSPEYTAIYGSFGGNGVIIITSKTGRDAIRSPAYNPTGILAITPPGISITKEFYKPSYTTGSTQQFQHDQRTTIHWEPNIITDKQGKAQFDFYTSDQPGTYRIILEGIDIHGRIVHAIKTIEVQ